MKYLIISILVYIILTACSMYELKLHDLKTNIARGQYPQTKHQSSERKAMVSKQHCRRAIDKEIKELYTNYPVEVLIDNNRVTLIYVWGVYRNIVYTCEGYVYIRSVNKYYYGN